MLAGLDALRRPQRRSTPPSTARRRAPGPRPGGRSDARQPSSSMRIDASVMSYVARWYLPADHDARGVLARPRRSARSPPARRGARGSATNRPRTRACGSTRRGTRDRARARRARAPCPGVIVLVSAKKLRRSACHAARYDEDRGEHERLGCMRGRALALRRSSDRARACRRRRARSRRCRAPRAGSPCWWRRPRSRGRSRAAPRTSRARACSRVAPSAITFAISESNAAGTVLPCTTPVSTRRCGPERRIEARDACRVRAGSPGPDPRRTRAPRCRQPLLEPARGRSSARRVRCGSAARPDRGR